VRARVAGIILERVYQEGSDVKKGDVLFKIDPAPFQADLDSALAAVRKAKATQYQTSLQAKRYTALVETQAVSKQDFENARAAELQAKADVAAALAEARRARLNLDYSTVTAPINGRIGKAMVTEGALVGQDSTTPLALIQQMNPMYADVTQSTRELSELRQKISSGALDKVDPAQARVRLIDDKGVEYANPGKLLFSDLNVDQGTGQITLRSQFPNADRELLPGSFVRVQVEQARVNDGLTVAERSVQRDASGKPNVMVVNKDNVTELKEVVLSGIHQGRWLVTSGIQAGDRVLVSGMQHAPAGTKVEITEKSAAAEQSEGTE